MKIVFDTKLKRPACVLLQAAMGGDPQLANLFPSESWLLSVTPDMGLYTVTPEQLPKIIKTTETAMSRVS
jgi:hypothetical protein